MRLVQTEYLLKGIFVGLLLFGALQAGRQSEPAWPVVAWVTLSSVAGLALALLIAAIRKIREGYRVQGRLPAFLLFLLLESPELIYAGTLLGALVGAFLVRTEDAAWLFTATVGGGAVLGVALGLLQDLKRLIRLGLSLVLGGLLVFGLLYWFGELPEQWQPGEALKLNNPMFFSIQLLLGIPLFYLLTFAGREEESEVEIGVMCAALGLGFAMLSHGSPISRPFGFILPVMLYFWYTIQVLPGLRVFKHSARGYSYARIGRQRQALLSFRRALQLDPQNSLAREGLWNVHLSLDMDKLRDDPEMLAIVDFDLCLERAGSLLLEPGPTPARLGEANRLLDLVMSQRPTMQPVVHYWRTVAHAHARQYDQAAQELERLLDPAHWTPDDAHRRGVLLAAWQLALRLHPELIKRVGNAQITLPGRRMEAIAAVERQLVQGHDDEAWNLKRLLYSNLNEEEYHAAVGATVAAEFDHDYAQQLGLALITDPARWQRGAEYLRLAARGLPASGPSIFTQIAQAHERAGDTQGALHYYELTKRAGLAAGPKSLSDAERQTFFAAVKLLGEAAQARGDLDAAVENYHLYTEYERSGVETLRILAGLHESKGDPLSAARCTDRALVYNATDKDLLARKDRYYYSILPESLQARLESVKQGFDVDYCVRKARALLSTRDTDLDVIDWAQQLATLAALVQPDNRTVKVLLARARLRRGERDEAVTLLESVRTPKPEKFANSADEEAWFDSCKLLGDLYLNELSKPDVAIERFRAFRDCNKSGADTLYKLGQAYEQLGDRARAAKFYENVTAYESHPLALDAREALYRLQSS